LIRHLAAGRTQHFPGLFAFVGWILAQGDEEAQNLMIAGFFGDLLTADEYDDTLCRPADFGRWLGPRTRHRRGPDFGL
jgi:hypothetical protein